jgi:pimeloyl-ACP methyl ester carboxylesterase
LPEYHPFRSAKARDRYLTYYDSRGTAWPVASETKLVSTDDAETFVRISGPADAPPLVLLPGAWDTSLMWTESIEALSQGFRTYAVDNPWDFGRSRNTQPVSGRIDYMKWLDGLFDGLALTDGINLIGCSFGGWLACDYTLHAPHRLARAVWLSPPFIVAPMSLQGNLGGGFGSLAAMALPTRFVVGSYMRWFMPDGVGTQWLVDYIDDAVEGLSCRKVGFPAAYPRMLTEAELAGIQVPVLYIRGENDRLASVNAAVARMNEMAPQIETAVISGAGHDLGVGQADAFSRRVVQFLTA